MYAIRSYYAYVPILSRGLLMRDVDGKANRIIGTHLDLTERYEAERLLKEQLDNYLALNEA